MDGFHLLVRRLLPSSLLEFPEEKLILGGRYWWDLDTYSVVGLSIDFVLLNLTKHSSYLIYNATLFFSSAVQKQYFEKYGFGQMIPVAANDVAFSTHAVLVTAFTLLQFAIYERGAQKISKIAIGIVVAVWLGAAVCFFIALPTHSWLWLINIFNSIQVFMTIVKYTPQAYLNFMRKSTEGLSFGFYLLDFCGGVANFAQMFVQSIDQDSWVNFYGNTGKVLLSSVCISFDILFMCQRFLLYPSKEALIPPPQTSKESSDPSKEALIPPPPQTSKESSEPLLRSSDHPAVSENV